MEPVLVATDGSVSSMRAVAYAGYMARRLHCSLRIVAVWRLPVALEAFGDFSTISEREETERATAEVVARQALSLAGQAGVPASTIVRHGDPAAEICAEAAACNAVAIVVGTRRIASTDVGSSVSDAVGAAASCPVLVVGLDGVATRRAPAGAAEHERSRLHAAA